MPPKVPDEKPTVTTEEMTPEETSPGNIRFLHNFSSYEFLKVNLISFYVVVVSGQTQQNYYYFFFVEKVHSLY